MKMPWKRLGRIFEPIHLGDWGVSHASYPVPLVIGVDTVRIFFSVRDRDNRAHAASADFRIDGTTVSGPSAVSGPLFNPGPRGAFDCDGVTIGCVVPHRDNLLAYYLGWTRTKDVPFTNFIGVAVGDAKGSRFERIRKSPIIGRSEQDPFSVGYPFVMKEGERWRMWYGTHTEWGAKALEMVHVIREATSVDGINWTPSDDVCIPVLGGEEFAVSRPWVVKQAGGYRMYYARRYPKYRLGTAFSHDGQNWSRNDGDFQLTGDEEEWEAGEQTYASFFNINGTNYMLYNGSGYGRSGFGLAMEQLYADGE